MDLDRTRTHSSSTPFTRLRSTLLLDSALRCELSGRLSNGADPNLVVSNPTEWLFSRSAAPSPPCAPLCSQRKHHTAPHTAPHCGIHTLALVMALVAWLQMARGCAARRPVQQVARRAASHTVPETSHSARNIAQGPHPHISPPSSCCCPPYPTVPSDPFPCLGQKWLHSVGIRSSNNPSIRCICCRGTLSGQPDNPNNARRLRVEPVAQGMLHGRQRERRGTVWHT